MNIILETKRLILREFDISDTEKLFELNADPEVIQYTGDEAFGSVENTESFLKNYGDYKKNGFGRWSVLLKSNMEFIGWCGLKLNEEGFVDIGFRYLKKYWNKGFATEAAKACLNYGFNHLDISEIVGRVAQDNLASIRVLEKMNMTYWKKDECHGINNALYYRMNKVEFNSD